jgi:hypothetical protein
MIGSAACGAKWAFDDQRVSAHLQCFSAHLLSTAATAHILR